MKRFIFEKRQLKLNEYSNKIVADVNGTNPSDALKKATNVLKNPNVDSAEETVSDADGTKDNAGEGQKIPIDVSDKQNSIQKMNQFGKNSSLQNSEYQFYDGRKTKIATIPVNNGDAKTITLKGSSNGVSSMSESIKFTKSELSKFLKSL